MTCQADRELISELRRSSEGIVFDELPMPHLTVDDLSLDAARELFAHQHALTEQELLTLRLLTRGQGRLVPTKGAVLLFGKERQRYFADAWVQCGRFMGRDKIQIFDHIEQWGSGVRRIFSEAQALGLPEPDIIEIGMRLRLTVYLAGQTQQPHAEVPPHGTGPTAQRHVAADLRMSRIGLRSTYSLR